MTRKDAVAIILSIARGPRELTYVGHFGESSGTRGFTAQDVYYILRSYRLEPGPPEWNEKTGAFRVRLIGTCLEGRRTRLVLDLRADGPCTAVTIMEHIRIRKKRKSK